MGELVRVEAVDGASRCRFTGLVGYVPQVPFPCVVGS